MSFSEPHEHVALPPDRGLRNIIYWCAVSVVFAIFMVACLQGINNVWQWGHNGMNGAAFSNGARNTLRFGQIGQALYYTDLDPPDPKILYTHHPMMLHFHLVIMQAFLGDSEVAGRLVPAAYSFMILLLLFVVVRKLWGDLMALMSITLYVLTPINLIFANMINHEQISIFWCLAMLYAYIRWTETRRKIHVIQTLVFVTIAVQCDWPGYYFAFFLAVYTFLTGLLRSKKFLSWQPEYTWVLIFSVVVLANFFGFFYWISTQHGDLNEMKTVFENRSGPVFDYWDKFSTRTMDLQGILMILLFAGWLQLFLKRLIKGEAKQRDIIPVMFLLCQTLHSLLFKQAGAIHSYWTIYLGVALAIGGADLLLTLSDWLSTNLLVNIKKWVEPTEDNDSDSPLRWRSVSYAKAFICSSVLIPVVLFQGQFAFEQYRWGISKGHSAYVFPYRDCFHETVWIKELSSRYKRQEVFYIVHHSIKQRRIEFTYYLNAPHRMSASLHILDSDRERGLHSLLLVDLHNITVDSDLERLRMLSTEHPTQIWDRRFIAIDVAVRNSEQGVPKFSAWIKTTQKPDLLWTWLVNAYNPPFQWIPDPRPDRAKSLLLPIKHLVGEQISSNRDGHFVKWICPQGQTITSFIASTNNLSENYRGLESLQPLCTSLSEPEPPVADTTYGPYLGGWPPQNPEIISCKEGTVATGIFGKSGALIDNLGMICSRLEQKGTKYTLKKTFLTETVGSPRGGKRFYFSCPPETVLSSFRGRSGTMMLGVGIGCTPLNKILAPQNSDSFQIVDKTKEYSVQKTNNPKIDTTGSDRHNFTEKIPIEITETGNKGTVHWTCSPEKAISGLNAGGIFEAKYSVVNSIQFLCSTPSVLKSATSPLRTKGPWLGVWPTTERSGISCKKGKFAIGIFGTRNQAQLSTLGLVCASYKPGKKKSKIYQKSRFIKVRQSRAVGSKGKIPFKFQCPEGEILTGFTGDRINNALNALVCTKASKIFPKR